MTDTDGGTRPARRYRGLDPDQRRQDRRRRLLDAGLELFGTAGFAGTTITGLCRTAGITTQHFYDEFGSKEALLWAVFDDTVNLASERVGTALAEAPLSLEARIRAGMGAFLHAMLDDPRRARIQCMETVGIGPEFERRRRELLWAYAGLVGDSARAIAEQDGRSARGTRFITTTLVAGVNDAMIEWLHLEDPPAIDAMCDELVELWVLVGEHFLGAEPEVRHRT